jgi:hypothetical protein
MDWRWKVAVGTALELSVLPRVPQILSIAANAGIAASMWKVVVGTALELSVLTRVPQILSIAANAASIAANAMIAASMPKLHRKQFIIAV